MRIDDIDDPDMPENHNELSPLQQVVFQVNFLGTLTDQLATCIEDVEAMCEQTVEEQDESRIGRITNCLMYRVLKDLREINSRLSDNREWWREHMRFDQENNVKK